MPKVFSRTRSQKSMWSENLSSCIPQLSETDNFAKLTPPRIVDLAQSNNLCSTSKKIVVERDFVIIEQFPNWFV